MNKKNKLRQLNTFLKTVIVKLNKLYLVRSKQKTEKYSYYTFSKIIKNIYMLSYTKVTFTDFVRRKSYY